MADAGQMRSRSQGCFAGQFDHGVVGPFAGRSARAVSHGNEGGGKGLKTFDAFPQLFLHPVGFGGKELERHFYRLGQSLFDGQQRTEAGHGDGSFSGILGRFAGGPYHDRQAGAGNGGGGSDL